MEASDIMESLAYALPFLAIAGVFYLIAARKKRLGRKLHAQAKHLLASGRDKEARELLLQALWKANEEPGLERQILDDLGQFFQEAWVDVLIDDYRLLVRQFEALAKKGSHKAISEMKKVQGLKQALIDRMPSVEGETQAALRGG